MKKVISAILITAMLLSILAMGGCSIFDKSGDLPKFEKGKLFYADGYVFYLKGDEVELLTREDEEGDSDVNIPLRSQGSYDTFTDGKVIYYASPNDTVNVYKDFDNGNFKTDEILDDDDLYDLFDMNEDAFFPSDMMSCWQVVGDKAYFVVLPGKEYINLGSEQFYNIGWISLDGKDGELFDVAASSFAVADNRIYYFSNGYDGGNLDFEGDRGLYSMNLNGDDREEIYVDEYNADYYGRDYAFANQMKAVGKYIYFIDSSEKGENRVARLDTKTNDVEHITEKGAFSFAVDEKGKKVYYAEGESGRIILEARDFRVADIDGKDDEKLFEMKADSGFNNCLLFCDGGYLYISSYNTRESFGRRPEEDKPAKIAARYHLGKDEMEVLFGYLEEELVMEKIPGPGGIRAVEKIIDREFFTYWEEDDSIID
ncbi:MAG: DUF5050 domain-containing protein [Ruminococcus sp.]|nr:DUF5050 domain-containing protein [Ruminococcus sp.]